MNLLTILKNVATAATHISAIKSVIDRHKKEREPKPITKKRDTTKLTEEQKKYIKELHTQWGATLNARELTTKINQELGLNKSVDVYRRIWK
jgi:DNA-binding MarR family transcriptional regulator